VETLAARDYTDPQVNDLERSAIFGREWLCLGPAAAVADPGGYLAEVVAGWPIVVVRGPDGTLRGFHNVCRHRAGPLVDDGPGACRSLVCRYHGWAYGLDGSLLSARDAGLDPADVEGLDLYGIRAEEWRGLLFVCLDPDAPALAAWLGGFAAECDGHPMETWQPFERRTIDVEADWKTYGDNYLEGYHVPLVHPGLTRTIEASTYRIDVADGWSRHHAQPRDGAITTGTWLWHWPNLGLNLYERGMSVERWYPRGPGRCTLVLDYCFDDVSATARPRIEEDLAFSATVCDEDRRICEAVQRNLSAGVYESGLLSPRHEHAVADFHRRILAARKGA
jgi:choline monooxygenase